MPSSVELWSYYHQAVQAGNIDKAKEIMRTIQQYKSNPPPPPGGCSRCRRRF